MTYIQAPAYYTVTDAACTGLTCGRVEDEVPHSRRGETGVTAREASEAILQQVGPGADRPGREAVNRVLSELLGRLTPI